MKRQINVHYIFVEEKKGEKRKIDMKKNIVFTLLFDGEIVFGWILFIKFEIVSLLCQLQKIFSTFFLRFEFHFFS